MSRTQYMPSFRRSPAALKPTLSTRSKYTRGLSNSWYSEKKLMPSVSIACDAANSSAYSACSSKQVLGSDCQLRMKRPSALSGVAVAIASRSAGCGRSAICSDASLAASVSMSAAMRLNTPNFSGSLSDEKCGAQIRR